MAIGTLVEVAESLKVHAALLGLALELIPLLQGVVARILRFLQAVR